MKSKMQKMINNKEIIGQSCKEIVNPQNQWDFPADISYVFLEKYCRYKKLFKTGSLINQTSDNMTYKAFTLIEVILAVAILGIVAAIALPMYGGHIQHSKEASAQDELRIIRSQIELYTFEHKGLSPGYFINPLGIKSQATLTMLINQFVGTSSFDGNAVSSRSPSGMYIYGPYLQKLPVNPFNNLSTIKYVPSATAFSTAADKTTGWLYKKETREFKLNWTGTDSAGKNYLDY